MIWRATRLTKPRYILLVALRGPWAQKEGEGGAQLALALLVHTERYKAGRTGALSQPLPSEKGGQAMAVIGGDD